MGNNNKKSCLTYLLIAFGAFIAIIFLSVMAVSILTVLVSDTSEENNSETIKTEAFIEEENTTPEQIGFEHNGLHIKYSHHQILNGDLYVYFEMTNNSSESESFDYTFEVIGWQEGIELDTNYIYDCEEEKNASKEIKPGASILVAEIFELRSATETATIEFRPWMSFNEKTLYEFNIELN